MVSQMTTGRAVLDDKRSLGGRARIPGTRPPARVPPEDGLFARMLPGAQPLACALLLAAGITLERVAPGLAVPAYVLAYVSGGTGSAAAAWRALRRGRVDVNLLMLLAAAGAAYLGAWSEGTVLLFLFSLSNALEYYVTARTRRAIRSLMALRPPEALVRRDGAQAVVPADTLEVGDLVIVRPAERLPADGVVIHGASSIDQSPITGESMPVDVTVGSQVFAGTINQRGSLEVEVRRSPEDTTLARIIALVEQAQSAQAPVQRVIDRLGQVYALAVILGAGVIYAVLLGSRLPGDLAFYRAITLLVVASPCAVVISTPATILSAIANGARRGVLFKGGASLERLAGIETVVFDKTGTLTAGTPVVTDVVALEGGEPDLLATAAALEQRSEHALADAVVAACRERGLQPLAPETFEAMIGRGVRGRVRGAMVRVGSETFIKEEGVAVPPACQPRLAQLRGEGKTLLLVAADRLLGIIAVTDTLRPQAVPTVRALRAMGIRRLVMLSGDHTQAAEVIGRQLGLDEVRADLLPDEKAAVVETLARKGTVAMVGDGVNDAPALAAASVGIAMGVAGTDAAMETAGVVLMGDGLSRLPYAIGLSRQARRVVAQNLTFSFAVIVGLIASVFGVGLRLASGVVGHEGSTVVVVLNGLRLLGYRPRR